MRTGPALFESVGQHLGLLSIYFPGYDVTWGGAFLGFIYGFFVGYATNWLAMTLIFEPKEPMQIGPFPPSGSNVCLVQPSPTSVFPSSHSSPAAALR